MTPTASDAGPGGGGARTRRAPPSAALSALLPAALLLASASAGCLGGRGAGIELRLTRAGGAAVAGEEVELRFENPPGGILQFRTDAEGRVTVPAKYAGLRFQVGTDCARPGQCRRYYAPSKLEGGAPAVELTGGVNYP